MTIKIIYDNCKHNQDLQEGWGFSALIERGNRKILFDTGNDQTAFFSNLEKMDVDYREITDVVFSHKHHDHVAGCKEILGNLRDNTRVFVPKGFPLKKLPKNIQVQKVEDFAEIDKDLFSLVLKGGLFLYEQSLILQTEKGLIVITGCAHSGIVNILESAQKRLGKPIHLVLGGFHLFRKSRKVVEEIVSQFQALGIKTVAPCHCSGELAMGLFKEAYGDNFYKIGTGSILNA